MSTGSVSLDGFPVVGTTPAGGRARIVDLEGWISRSIRRGRHPRAGQGGDWPSTGHDEGRNVTLKSRIFYDDAVTAATERRAMAALGGQSLTEFTVTDALGSLTAKVETDLVRAVPATHTIVEFTAILHAPDPLLYGPESYSSAGLAASAGGTGLVYPLAYPLDYGLAPGVTPGAVSVTNEGTAAYWPRLRIDGPVTNPVVTMAETGAWVRYNGTLAAGQWLDIDTGLRRVLLNGQVSHRHKVSSGGNWLAVPVGGGSLSWVDDGGHADALLSVWFKQGAWS